MKGTALQEVNFWASLEQNLKKIDEKLEAPEVGENF